MRKLYKKTSFPNVLLNSGALFLEQYKYFPCKLPYISHIFKVNYLQVAIMPEVKTMHNLEDYAYF